MFRLTISTSNEAFDDALDWEVRRLLRHAAAEIESGRFSGDLIDFNGNRVGSYHLSDGGLG